MFIVFEGVDRSGKSTLSKLFCDYLNTTEGMQVLLQKDKDVLPKYLWTKEPQFTTEEADRLNSDEFKDEYKREAFFFSDRIKHQAFLKNPNVICDRYLWTGLAYAKKFSPNCYPAVEHLYVDKAIFKMPDLYIYVDTDLKVCHERDTTVGFERLQSIRDAYKSAAPLVQELTPIIWTSAEGTPEESLEILKTKFKDFMAVKKS